MTQGFRIPNGGRNHLGGEPSALQIALWQRRSSTRTCVGASHKRYGCVSVWFPTVCPRGMISFTSSGHSRTYRPIKKNVSFFFFCSSGDHSYLHSFPTRRSSDHVGDQRVR